MLYTMHNNYNITPQNITFLHLFINVRILLNRKYCSTCMGNCINVTNNTNPIKMLKIHNELAVLMRLPQV